jgi:hypothetical protein
MTVAAKGFQMIQKWNYINCLRIIHNCVFYPYAGASAARAAARLCNNLQPRHPLSTDATAMLDVRMTQWKRVLLWLMLAALAALVAYLGIRGYLSPEMLFSFSNSFSC